MRHKVVNRSAEAKQREQLKETRETSGTTGQWKPAQLFSCQRQVYILSWRSGGVDEGRIVLTHHLLTQL